MSEMNELKSFLFAVLYVYMKKQQPKLVWFPRETAAQIVARPMCHRQTRQPGNALARCPFFLCNPRTRISSNSSKLRDSWSGYPCVVCLQLCERVFKCIMCTFGFWSDETSYCTECKSKIYSFSETKYMLRCFVTGVFSELEHQHMLTNIPCLGTQY